MFKNYLKTAWRNLAKNKFYTAINITGLATGLAVGIMILLWVQHELSYDRFHQNAESIYKINSHLGTGASAQVWEGAPGALSVFSNQIPEVIRVVRINEIDQQLTFKYRDKQFNESKLAFVDPSFFSVFDFKLLEGSNAKPFPNDNSIVITSSEAKKYFGDDHLAMGKTLATDQGNFMVSGVIADFPDNSSMQYNMLLPMDLYAQEFTSSGGNGAWKTIDEDLGNYYFRIYLQLRPGASPEKVAKQISQIYAGKRKGDAYAKDNFFTLQSLTSLHLRNADGNAGGLQTVRIFLIVAILILCIACINYINLSTARSLLRSKEVSVRKIIGAARTQLFLQFIIETLVLFLFASLLALLLIYILMPLYNDISGRHLVFSFSNSGIWLVIGCTIVGSLVLSALYPALQLSAFRPIESLSGKLSLGIAQTFFRKALVVTQFVFSVALIIATIVISRQLKYIRSKDLGFDKEYVFSFALKKEMHDHLDAFRNELRKQPGVLGVTSINGMVAGINGTTGDTDWDGKEPNSTFLIHQNGIDKDLIPLLKMKMVQGHNFTGSPADSTHFILNETAVRQAGIKDPIGKRFTLWQNKGTIIGVVKDFNYASLKTAIEPAIFYYEPSGWVMYVKTTGADAQKAVAGAQRLWKQYGSESPFEYAFLDDDFNRMYIDDQRTGELFNVFTVVAILISCLGLLGLATYTAQVKTKEIGIRKVLGASIVSIIRLLAREFIVLVLIAFVIAAPVAWFLMNQWLHDFAYRIHINGWIFLITGLLAIAIALITVGFQAIKAALANPVTSLRSE
jgi:putative ABC transport system permease protein